MDTKTEVLPVMGQDQDEFGGKFEAAQSFSGKLANLRVMNRTLKPNEVAERNPFVHKDYWTLFNDWKFSNVDLTFEVQENFQKENIFRNYLLTFINIDFYRSKEICDLAQGRLPLPETEEEFEKITEIFSSILKSNNVTGGLGYLLGYIFKPEKDNWFNVYTKKAVPKTHFLHGNKRLDKNCFLRWPPKNDFYPISCKQRTAAQFCKVDNGLELHLKGFCSEEENMRELLFDDWYYLFGIKNERPHFQ